MKNNIIEENELLMVKVMILGMLAMGFFMIIDKPDFAISSFIAAMAYNFGYIAGKWDEKYEDKCKSSLIPDELNRIRVYWEKIKNQDYNFTQGESEDFKQIADKIKVDMDFCEDARSKFGAIALAGIAGLILKIFEEKEIVSDVLTEDTM